MVSGDDSAKKGAQLSLIEESYISKESEKQLRSRYDQFIHRQATLCVRGLMYVTKRIYEG